MLFLGIAHLFVVGRHLPERLVAGDFTIVQSLWHEQGYSDKASCGKRRTDPEDVGPAKLKSNISSGNATYDGPDGERNSVNSLDCRFVLRVASR